MSGSLPRLVLIEDSAADVLLVREALAQAGVEVELVWYSDAPEAITGLCEANAPLPHAILIDLNLPRGEGISVIQALRAFPQLSGVPIAVLTSSHSPRDREQAERLAISRYIRKPSTLDRFIAEIGGAVKELLSGTKRISAKAPDPGRKS